MKTKELLIGTLCIVMISMLVYPAFATQYCYGWQDLQSNVTGVMSSVKLTSAVHAQSGSYMQKWDAIAVMSFSGGNPYNIAEINLAWYQDNYVSQLWFTAAVLKQGTWQTDVTTIISVAYLDSNNIRIGCGKNGNTWQFYYSLNGGSSWTTMRQFDFGYSWIGDRYVTTFEDDVGAMTASNPPTLAGQTTGIQYQDNGWSWVSANLDTVWNYATDPHITYAHGTDYETATFHL